MVGQLYEDKPLALRARDLIFFTTALQTVKVITQNITARADLFLNQNCFENVIFYFKIIWCWFL